MGKKKKSGGKKSAVTNTRGADQSISSERKDVYEVLSFNDGCKGHVEDFVNNLKTQKDTKVNILDVSKTSKKEFAKKIAEADEVVFSTHSNIMTMQVGDNLYLGQDMAAFFDSYIPEKDRKNMQTTFTFAACNTGTCWEKVNDSEGNSKAVDAVNEKKPLQSIEAEKYKSNTFVGNFAEAMSNSGFTGIKVKGYRGFLSKKEASNELDKKSPSVETTKAENAELILKLDNNGNVSVNKRPTKPEASIDVFQEVSPKLSLFSKMSEPPPDKLFPVPGKKNMEKLSKQDSKIYDAAKTIQDTWRARVNSTSDNSLSR